MNRALNYDLLIFEPLFIKLKLHVTVVARIGSSYGID